MKDGYRSEPLTYKHGLLTFVEPMLREAIRSLEDELRRYPFFEEVLLLDLVRPLREKVFELISKAVVVELHLSKIQGKLEGTTAEERFWFFCGQLQNSDLSASILRSYPVMMNQLEICLKQWKDHWSEVFYRLYTDWRLIESTWETSLVFLEKIDANLGDSHNFGRSVLSMSFSSGQKLVYKPRSAAVDIHFQNLLQFLNERSAFDFRLLRIVDKESYGWFEFVDKGSCQEHEDVKRFYYRLGGLLAILYALEATDFHYGNLIAAGDQPILIDLETLFHPRIKESSNPLSFSVIRTGLLPYRISYANDEGIDFSGIHADEGLILPDKQPVWIDPGLDTMRLVYQDTCFKMDGKHRPMLRNSAVSALDYVNDLVKGFEDMYDLWMHYRLDILDFLQCFQSDEIRAVLRPTRQYSLLLREMNHPLLLKDQLQMEQFLKEKLSIAWKAAPEFKRVFQMEHAALNRHDIPYFMTTPESRDLWTKDGVLVEEFFSSSALDNVKRRIQSFSVEDRDNQCWMIRASVGTLAKTHVSMKEEFKEEQGDWSEEEAILIAIRIGERLQKLSYGDNEINWLGLHGSGSVWRLRPLSVDLYDGLAGVILFLAFLGEKVQSECFLDLVRRSLHTVRSVWNREKEVSLGAYNGWLGVLYTLMHLSDLWNEPSYLEWGRDIVKRIADPSKDEVLDWIGGSAGAIHVLLSFFERIREERAKRLAIQCGEHLLNQSVFIDGGQGWNTLEVRPLTGIAHGAAGIALALARLFHVTGDKRFFEAVTDALNWERSQFSSEDMNWIDWRGGVSKTKSIQWCAGAPGVGLSRIYLHSILKESYCLEEVRKAFEITYLQGFGDNDSLCHGNLGNLLFLQKAAAILNDPVYQALFEARRSQVLASLKKGWRCGTPNQLDTPGLMVGLSGIGLGLLKLVDDRIPCVLSLQ